MVTTQRAEGFSPPTTKGMKPAISVVLEGGFICPSGHHAGQEGGWGGAFPSSFFLLKIVFSLFYRT